MTITVTRDRTAKMRHVVAVRNHRFPVDELAAVGGEDSGPTPHDLYDAALGGPLSAAQREELLAVAGKCPVHRLMTQVTTEISTALAPASP